MKTRAMRIAHTNTQAQPLPTQAQPLHVLLCSLSLLLITPALAQTEAGEATGNLAPEAEAAQQEPHAADTHADPAAAIPNADDPIFGTWELNTGLSVYSGAEVEAPRKQTRIYKPHPDGVEATAVTINPDGRETSTDYTAGFDGVPHPVHGLANSDSIKLERRNPYLSVATFLHAGMPTGTSERVISPDGRRLTITLVIDGEVISKSVYDRVE